VRHWLCTQQSNLEAAHHIVAHRDDPALACLVAWAELYIARHGQTSPITPPDRQPEFELT
jgi:hypothetical protein